VIEHNIVIQYRYEGDIVSDGVSITLAPEYRHHISKELPYARHINIRHGNHNIHIRIPHKEPHRYTIEERYYEGN